jgi:hypothetical protein
VRRVGARADESVQVVVAQVPQLKTAVKSRKMITAGTWALEVKTNHFELLLQFPGNIHLAPVDFLNGEHSAPVEADRRVERRVTEISLGVRAERHLRGAHQRMHHGL